MANNILRNAFHTCTCFSTLATIKHVCVNTNLAQPLVGSFFFFFGDPKISAACLPADQLLSASPQPLSASTSHRTTRGRKCLFLPGVRIPAWSTSRRWIY